MGGGVVVAIAAALWLAYLIPVMLRRREYLATERNAVRLQQTLRILAETSELPDEVRVEATARTVAEQQRILKRAEERRLAQARAEAAAHARRELAIAEEQRRVAEEAERAAAEAIALERASRAAAAQRARALDVVTWRPPLSASRRRRLRRTRAMTTAALVAGVAATLTGATVFATGGTPLLLVAGGIVGIASIAVLVRLARPQRTAVAAPRAALSREAQGLYDDAQHDRPAAPPARQQSWTPRPLPKPLHLSPGTIAAGAMASIDAATELRRAAARVELERKAAERFPAPAPTPLRPVAVPAAVPAAVAGPVSPAPSRYATMGLVDVVQDTTIDLDAVLRRRRAAS
jgi:hypothetical protein